MNKNIRTAVIATLSVIALTLLSRAFFIRTVNYNIGGVDIPARYNVLTGKAVPIFDYKGKAIKTTVTDNKTDKMGMSRSEVLAAQVRWALFEEWAKTKPEHKGWESDPEIFRKASEEFKKKMPTSVTVLN